MGSAKRERHRRECTLRRHSAGGDRGSLRRGKHGADARGGTRGEGRGRGDASRRSVQAAHFSARFSGAWYRGLADFARGAPRNGIAHRHGSDGPAIGEQRSPNTRTCCRLVRATCRIIRCSIEAGKSGKPVLLKRGMAASLCEWLGAAEYIAKEGNLEIVLCERGIKAYPVGRIFAECSGPERRSRGEGRNVPSCDCGSQPRYGCCQHGGVRRVARLSNLAATD